MEYEEITVKSCLCQNCGENFNITERDAAYYKRIEVPHPTWCPLCRHVRRHGHINDYVFYSRECDCCRKSFVSLFPKKSEFTVFCQECWYSEQRDDKAQGREYDPGRSFFAQFGELLRSTPQLGIIGSFNENCDYCESVANCKNCYLISECSNCEDCLFCYWIQVTKDSVDCCFTHDSERCYELIDCFNCYNLQYSQNCTGCSDSYFLDSCIGCRNCFLCVNLRQKEYHIFNQPFQKEKYFIEVNKLLEPGYLSREALRTKFLDFICDEPRKHLQLENVENCSGNFIRNAKNCKHVFHCYDAEDCAYGEHVLRGARDCYDANTAGLDAELIYESTNCALSSYAVKFCRYCWSSRFIEYCNQCQGGSYLFGCTGLRPGAKFCILNKQYSERDYHALVAKIKGRMLEDKEYGEFFPLSLALFGYNNSVSYDDQPYTMQEILQRGWKWEQQSPGTHKRETLDMQSLPLSITEISDTLCNEVLTCAACARNYRIISQELAFYRTCGIPIPQRCPDCRHRVRLGRRGGKKLYRMSCSECGLGIESAYNPQSYTRIMCTQCYNQAVVF